MKWVISSSLLLSVLYGIAEADLHHTEPGQKYCSPHSECVANGIHDEGSSCQQDEAHPRPSCQDDDEGVVQNKKNSLSDGLVHHLGLDNFASIIGSSSFTLVLFYDRADEGKAKLTDQREILGHLAYDYSQMDQPSSFFLRNLKVSFAEMDIRQHAHIRRMYSPRGTRYGLGHVWAEFYQRYNDLDRTWHRIPPTMINSETFMAKEESSVPTLPGRFMLIHGDDYNVIDYIHKNSKLNNKDPVVDDSFSSVQEWMAETVRAQLHFVMQGVGEQRFDFGESKDGPPAKIKSRYTNERELKRKYEESNPMDTLNLEQADLLIVNESDEEEKPLDDDLYLTGTDEEGDTFHKFRLASTMKEQYDAEIMNELTLLIELYLVWADSYENQWDDQRKAREDERTNYGYYLNQMNQQMKDMLFSVFDDLKKEGISALVNSHHIPDLQRYYTDMIFGFGRSPLSLENYLHDEVYGNTPQEASSVALFERIREYMRIREATGVEHEMYSMYFKTLWIKWHAIMAEFHSNLSRHYIAYQKGNRDVNTENYNMAKLDVIDMQDPDNFSLLSDYDEFERRYVAQRKPFILSNVELTGPFNYTLDFLEEKCGFVEVTKKIKKCFRVGEESVKSWGGLSKFELPARMATSRRLSWDKEDDEEKLDTSLSLQQFIALAKRMDNIYLHDFSLIERCSGLFNAKSPYDAPEEQYFKIPSVIGRYDLFQKVPHTSFMHTWPSLFIGRKGTNSKIHIDAGASGFWMYLVSGRKRWVIYDSAERPFLYERLNRKHSFVADVLALNSRSNVNDTKTVEDYFDATYPLVKRATSESRGYEIIQHPGELVYIPPNAPHSVENLEDIVGISFNQIPRAGVKNHLHSLIHGSRDFAKVEIILRYFLSDDSQRASLAESLDPLYVSLGEYIAQP